VAHNNLGLALAGQGREREAEAAYREALRLRPNFPLAHYNLGGALLKQGREREAEAAFREALRLRPDFPLAHYNLGVVLARQRREREAEAAYREALRLRPDHPVAHNNLGLALAGQGREREAEAAYREALRLRPDFPEAHCNLGHVLRRQGRFLEALEAMRLGHGLGSKSPGWRYPSAAWVRGCERLVEFDRLLPHILQGDAEPASPAEGLELADLCRHPSKRLCATSARLAAAAFAAQPKLADDLNEQHRYNAACSGALAAAGQAEDAKLLPDKVADRLRRQALQWLRADLALYEELARRDDPKWKAAVRLRLQHWLKDADLGSVRDPAALQKLPEAERREWQGLWSEVDGLLGRAEGKKQGP
jgi:Flp pilus assembly protein TadD